MGKTKRKKRTIARICSMIGVSLLILMILICIPLTLPRLAGFDIYTVVTGSMEPARKSYLCQGRSTGRTYGR